MYGIDSYCLSVRNSSFHQPQFDWNSSWLDFFEKVFIYVKERLFLKWYKGRKWFFPSHSIWSKSVSNNFSEKKNHQRESDNFLRNDPLQQDWVEIAIFCFRGSLFSASCFFFFFAPFFIFWSILQLLVLATFGDFLEDSFLALFSASGLSNFWRGRHFSASGLDNFWLFFGGFVFLPVAAKN